jgi:hypothetical protein
MSEYCLLSEGRNPMLNIPQKILVFSMSGGSCHVRYVEMLFMPLTAALIAGRE